MTKIFNFEEFQSLCADKGYTAREEPKYKLYYVRTKNGVKTEISYAKKLTYTIGFGLTPDELILLEEEITTKGFIISSIAAKWLRLVAVNDDTLMPGFWKLVEILEDIDGIVARSRGIATQICSRQEAEESIFEKIAATYFFAVEKNHQFLLNDHRHVLCADDIDHILTRGESVNRTEIDSYREHIVPCIMIHNEAIRMVLDGSLHAEVAQMIATNLAIVRITNSEADLLDHKLKLKTTMPEGWKFGDDVFARLNVAKIQLK
jgi:hypothetical protein